MNLCFLLLLLLFLCALYHWGWRGRSQTWRHHPIHPCLPWTLHPVGGFVEAREIQGHVFVFLSRGWSDWNGLVPCAFHSFPLGCAAPPGCVTTHVAYGIPRRSPNGIPFSHPLLLPFPLEGVDGVEPESVRVCGHGPGDRRRENLTYTPFLLERPYPEGGSQLPSSPRPSGGRLLEVSQNRTDAVTHATRQKRRRNPQLRHRSARPQNHHQKQEASRTTEPSNEGRRIPSEDPTITLPCRKAIHPREELSTAESRHH